MSPEEAPDRRLLINRTDLAREMSMSTGSLWRLVRRDRTFPRPLRLLGPNDRPRWNVEEVRAWLRSRARAQATEAAS